MLRSRYSKELKRTARLLLPSDAARDEMLRTVLTESGVRTGPSFPVAMGWLAGIAKSALRRTVGSIVATAVGVSAVGVAGVAMLTPPAVESARVEALGWNSARIVVNTNFPLAIGTVEVIPDGGEPMIAEHRGDGLYEITVCRNGIYRIEVLGHRGKTAKSNVAVTGLDTDIPVMERFEAADETVTIWFSDALSGVDWDALSAVDEAGDTVLPLYTDAAAGTATFALPASHLDVFVQDLAGNRAVCTVDID